MNRLLPAIATVSAFSLALPALAQDDDPIVATVGDHEIRQSDVLEGIQALPPQYSQQVPPEILIPAIAEQLAVGRAVQDLGYEAGLADDAEVLERMAEAEGTIVQAVWLERELSEAMTDERLEAAYEAFLEANPPVEQVRARHILVETEEEGVDLIRQLNEGAEFEELAREHSTGPSAETGGDLGYFAENDMVAPFGETAFALEPGEFTQDPVETQFGWHVIYLEDRRSVEPPALDEIRDQLAEEVQVELTREIIEEVRSNADIVIYGPDGEPIGVEAEAESAEETTDDSEAAEGAEADAEGAEADAEESEDATSE